VCPVHAGARSEQDHRQQEHQEERPKRGRVEVGREELVGYVLEIGVAEEPDQVDGKVPSIGIDEGGQRDDREDPGRVFGPAPFATSHFRVFRGEGLQDMSYHIHSHEECPKKKGTVQIDPHYEEAAEP